MRTQKLKNSQQIQKTEMKNMAAIVHVLISNEAPSVHVYFKDAKK